jgi:protein-S-isoprenylcysteine O-methyltransferase Ste14
MQAMTTPTIVSEPARQSATGRAANGLSPIAARLLDWGERWVVLAFYAWLVYRLTQRGLYHGELGNLMLLPSEGLVVLFILVRRHTSHISPRAVDWLLSFAATVAPMLVLPGAGDAWVPAAVGAGLLVTGTIVQVHAKLSLGRSFGCVPANRGVKRTGPYQWVRHPMYAGYLLGHIAFVLMNPTPWNLAVYGICYALQIPRLLAEEHLLDSDPQYRDYRQAVRFRLVPGLF